MAIEPASSESAEKRQPGKAADPGQGQQDEIRGDAPGRAVDGLADQPIHFIGGPVGAQAPGVQQIVVEVEFVLHVLDAGAQGPEQATLHQRRR